MKLERTKNATRNIVFGMMLKLYQILVPFLMRTVMVYYLGVEYLGLNSLFTSILSVLNLAELGVGSALVFSMYKPIAEDDEETICALMRLYRKYYRIIGSIVLVIGIIITPLLPNLIKGDIPTDLNLYVLYFINLAATVASYWLFAYKNSLFIAHQRSDVSSKVTLIVNTIAYVVQFLVLILFKNYYLYLFTTFMSTIAINVVTAIIAEKAYPNYKPKGSLDKRMVADINQKVRDLFTARLGAVVTNSADAIVISSFLGLTALAIYNNYFFIVTSIIGFAAIAYNSLMAGLGNSLITEGKEKNYNNFEVIVFIAFGCVSVCTTCFLNLFQPFMYIWMGKELMLNFAAVLSFCLYFVVYEINAVLNLFKDAAGIWHQDRFRPLTVSLVNLFLNLTTVRYWGIYGVLMSTVVSMSFIGIPWIIRNLFNNVFEKEYINAFIKKLVTYLFEILLISVISYNVCNLIKLCGITGLIIKLFVSVVLSFTIYIALNYKTKEFKDVRKRFVKK